MEEQSIEALKVWLFSSQECNRSVTKGRDSKRESVREGFMPKNRVIEKRPKGKGRGLTQKQSLLLKRGEDSKY